MPDEWSTTDRLSVDLSAESFVPGKRPHKDRFAFVTASKHGSQRRIPASSMRAAGRQDGKNTLRGLHPFEPLIILWVVGSIKNRPWLFRDPFCKERVCGLRTPVEGKDSSSVRRHGSTLRDLERVVIELAPMRRCASS